MDFISAELQRIWDVLVFVWQHTVAGIWNVLLPQIAPLIFATGAKFLQDYLTEKGYFRHVAILLLVIASGAILYVFSTTIREDHIEMRLFIGLLIVWGIAVYILICESLLLGLAHQLNKLKPQGRWVREIEYPYLLLGLIGLFVTINRMPVLEHRITDYDMYGPLILVTATAIKAVKIRAEVSEWNKL